MAGPLVIAIDPGHGGEKPSGSTAARTLSSPNNARTPSGIAEKTLTLELADDLREALETEAAKRGIILTVIMTRTSDENPDFAERTARCLAAGTAPAAIVSIHFNASEKHNALGSLGMIAHPSRNPHADRDRAFADGLAAACSTAVRQYLPASKPLATITDAHLHGGKGSNFFHQIAKRPELASTPVCFLEIEFIDRKDVDEALIARRAEAFPKIAQAIARQLLDDRK